MTTRRLSEAIMTDAAMTVDREAGLVKNVPILGLESPSRNRSYDKAAVMAAVKLFEGIPLYGDRNVGAVNLHEDWSLPASVFDLIGRLENARWVESVEQVRADVRPHAGRRDWFLGIAEDTPTVVGNSPRMLGKEEAREDGTNLVTEIVEVQRVDLVSRPGTVSGLHESQREGHRNNGGMGVDWKDVTSEELVKQRPDLVAAVKEAVLAESGKASDLDQLEQKVTTLVESMKVKDAELDDLKTQNKVAERKARAERMIKESGLPEVALSDAFRSMVEGAETDEAAKALIEDRVKLVEGTRAKPEAYERQPDHQQVSEGAEKPKIDDLASILTG